MRIKLCVTERIISLILLICLLFCTACGQTPQTNDATPQPQEEIETEVETDAGASEPPSEQPPENDKEASDDKDRHVPGQIYCSLKEYLYGQEVGEVADFCWNFLANFTITQNDEEHVFLTSPTTSGWNELWYWAKNSRDQDPDQWIFNANCRINENYGGTYLQLLFGTASKGGRYALLINPADYGYVELYHEREGEGIVANSWNPEMGATMRFGAGKDACIRYGEIFNVTINCGLLESDDSHIEILINDVPVLSYTADRVVMGDFGIGIDNMDAEVGDIVIKEFNGFLFDQQEKDEA